MSAETIREMAYNFLRNNYLAHVDVNHNNVLSGATVVESFIAREGDLDFVPLSWVVGVHIPDEALWDDIKTGKLNGFSLEGMGIKEPKVVEMNIPDNFELNTSLVQNNTFDCTSSLLHQVFLDSTLLRSI